MFPKWININVCHFLIHLIEMTSYNTYPILPSALPEAQEVPHSADNPQAGYHLKVVRLRDEG